MANKLWSQYSGGTAKPSSAPVAPPTPAPRITKPVYQEDKSFLGKIGDKITGALESKPGRLVSNVLMAPSRFFTGGVKALEAEGKGKDGPNLDGGFFSTEGTFLDPTFYKGGAQSVLHPQELDSFSGGFMGKGSILEKREQRGETITNFDKALAFGGEILYPTAAELGLSKLVGSGFKAAKASKAGQKAVKGADVIGDFFKKSKFGDVIEALEPGFKAPGAKKILDEAKDAANYRVNQLHKTIKTMSEGLSPDQQRIVGELMEGGSKAVANADEPLRRIAQQMNDLADEVGREGVELWEMTKGKIGLNPESFEELKGQYLPHIWNDMVKNGDKAFITEDAPSLLGQFWKKRTGKEGYIKEFGPASFKGLGTQIADNEIARGYIAIAEKYGIKPDAAADILKTKGPEALKDFGYTSADVINLKTAKIFEDVALPKEVVQFIKGSAARPGTDAFTKLFLEPLDKITNSWKLGKTIYNPAYHVRNIISNQILADMATGRGLPNTILDSFKSLYSYMGKGAQEYVSAAENVNLIRKASLVDNYKVLMQEADLIQKGNIRRFGDMWKTFQNHSEDIAKLSVFKSSIDDVVRAGGRSLDDVLADPTALKVAKDLAEEAIFSPYKIGAGERTLMSRIVPFYSFSRQAIPFTVKTAIKHPERLAKYERGKHAIESLSDNVIPEEDRPEWQKNSIQLPWKSKSGEPIALDTSYLYPWGNLGESPTTSLSRGQLPFGISINPFVSEAAQQVANKDFYFDRDISTSKLPGANLKDIVSTKPRRAGSQRWAHVANTVLPSLYRTYFGKLQPAFQGEKDYVGRDRDVWMALFDSFGLKTTVLRPDDKRMFDMIDQRKELKEIKSQMYSIAADQRLDDEEKKQLLEEYISEMEKLFQ